MKDYDAKQVVFTLGTHIVQGFAPDTKITVQRLNPMFTLTVGVDGETTRSKSNDKSTRITVRFQGVGFGRVVIAVESGGTKGARIKVHADSHIEIEKNGRPKLAGATQEGFGLNDNAMRE